MKSQEDIHRLVTKNDTVLHVDIQRRRNSKHLRLRFHPGRYRFTLSAPVSATEKKISAFLQRYGNHMEEYIHALPARISVERGKTYTILGTQYHIPSSSDGIQQQAMLLPIRHTQSVKQAVSSLLHSHCMNRVHLLLSLFPQLSCNAAPPSVTIRHTHGRWGSCSSDGRLMISSQLAFAPLEVINYVIAHECAHLKHHDHSRAFWQLVAKLHPEYKAHAEWLKEHGNALFSYQFVA